MNKYIQEFSKLTEEQQKYIMSFHNEPTLNFIPNRKITDLPNIKRVRIVHDGNLTKYNHPGMYQHHITDLPKTLFSELNELQFVSINGFSFDHEIMMNRIKGLGFTNVESYHIFINDDEDLKNTFIITRKV